MTAQETIVTLRRHAPAIRSLGATALYIYGSRARGDAQPGSDLDAYVEYSPASKFSLIELAGIKLLMEEMLGLDVDITTRDSLHPMLKADIEAEAIRVF
jgi:predicted nucleotidyltransferase